MTTTVEKGRSPPASRISSGSHAATANAAVNGRARAEVARHGASTFAAQQNVLGALLNGARWEDVRGIARDEDYAPEHRPVLRAIRCQAEDGKPHDLPSVLTLLDIAGHVEAAGGRGYLHELADNTITVDTMMAYARAVRDRGPSEGLTDAASPRREEHERDPQAFTDTDLANAARLAARYGSHLRYTAAAGWLVWDGARWREDPKTVQVQAFAKKTALAIFDEIKDSADRKAMMKHAQHSQSKRAIEAMIWLARSEPGVPAELTDFDLDPMLLNVANGTVDLRTGDLRPHRREDLLTRITPIAFDPAAECERWDGFLWQVLGQDQELYQYTRRLVGYLLAGKTSEQVLHFLYGLGANGKSVFCEVLEELLGDYAIVVSPELVMVRRHGGIPNDIARLRGVRAAFMNETSQGSRFDEAKLKDLTGGDTLTGRFLHQEFFDFPPTHKLIIRGNHKPIINGTDEGIWRRLRLIPFLVSIPPDEQDLELVEKLRHELPGILRWAVQGCLEWQREGLKPPPVIVEAVREYREESDTLGRFISECCITNNKLSQVKAGVLFQRYQQFAEAAGERWMPSKELPHEMRRRGFEQKRSSAGVLYLGIELPEPQGTQWHN